MSFQGNHVYRMTISTKIKVRVSYYWDQGHLQGYIQAYFKIKQVNVRVTISFRMMVKIRSQVPFPCHVQG